MPEGFPGLCSPSTLIADKSFAHIIHRTALCFPRCADHVLWSFNSHHILSSRYLPTHAMRSAWLDDGILPSTSLQTIQDTFCNKHKKALCVLTSNTSSLVQTYDHVVARPCGHGSVTIDSPGAFRHLPVFILPYQRTQRHLATTSLHVARSQPVPKEYLSASHCIA